MQAGPLTAPRPLCLNSPMIPTLKSPASDAYLGLGSNLGDRLELLQRARALLEATGGILVSASSPLYQTTPVGGPEGQRDYLNAVLRIQTCLGPRALLERCLEIEALLGRTRQVRWDARSLDLDLLLFGQTILAEPGLELPHPRMHLRRFVLAPLADLAPDLPHPLLGRTISTLLEECPQEGQEIQPYMESW